MNRASDNLDSSKLSATEEPQGYPPTSYPQAREGSSHLATTQQQQPTYSIQRVTSASGQAPNSPSSLSTTIKLLRQPPRSDSRGSDSCGLEPQTNSELHNEYSDPESEEEEENSSGATGGVSSGLLGSSISLRPAVTSSAVPSALRGITITSVADAAARDQRFSGSDYDSEEEEEERNNQQPKNSSGILNAFKNSSIVIGSASGELSN